jgi:hypothetical protein
MRVRQGQGVALVAADRAAIAFETATEPGQRLVIQRNEIQGNLRHALDLAWSSSGFGWHQMPQILTALMFLGKPSRE